MAKNGTTQSQKEHVFSIRKRGNSCKIRKKQDWKGTIFGQSSVVQKNKNTEIVLRRNKQKEGQH